MDAKHENLVIADLDSGIGVVPVALVRWSDVLSMTTLPPADETDGSGPLRHRYASQPRELTAVWGWVWFAGKILVRLYCFLLLFVDEGDRVRRSPWWVARVCNRM